MISSSRRAVEFLELFNPKLPDPRKAFGTTSGQFTGEIGSLDLELSNATASIYEIFALLFCEAHNPKVVSSNLTPATNLVCQFTRGCWLTAALFLF
jgi:hypothetical protein